MWLPEGVNKNKHGERGREGDGDTSGENMHSIQLHLGLVSHGKEKIREVLQKRQIIRKDLKDGRDSHGHKSVLREQERQQKTMSAGYP